MELTKKEKVDTILRELKIEERFIGSLELIEEINIDELEKTIKCLIKKDCSIYEIRIIITKNPNILFMNQEEINPVIELLEAEGFNEYIKDIVIKNPYILGNDKKVKNNIEFLKQYGFDKWEILNLITANATTLIEDIEKIETTFNILQQITNDKEKVRNVINSYPYILGVTELKEINEII